jgi:predicted nucleic acid-binding protein
VARWLAQRAAGVHTAVVDKGADEVVLDTNVFVAAGFNPSSHSACLVEAVRDGRLRMVWNNATRAEIEHVMRRIPRLSRTRIADLFAPRTGSAVRRIPKRSGLAGTPASIRHQSEVGRRNDLAPNYLDWPDVVHADYPGQGGLHTLRTEPAQLAEQLRNLRAISANVECEGRRFLEGVVVSAAFVTQALQKVELARQPDRATEFRREGVTRGWTMQRADHRHHSVGRALAFLGRALSEQGKFDEGMVVFEDGLAGPEARVAGMTLSQVLDWTAAVFGATGQPLRAARLFGAVEAQWREALPSGPSDL